MLIEIGRTYSVHQRTSHTFNEVTIYTHGNNTKVNAGSVWRGGGFLVRIEDKTEQDHLKNAMYIESENDDPEDFQSELFTNIKLQHSYGGSMPYLTCVGTGWKNEEQKDAFIRRYKDALKNDDEDFDGVDEWLQEQGFSVEECQYYIEDGIMVEMITGEDQLEPMSC